MNEIPYLDIYINTCNVGKFCNAVFCSALFTSLQGLSLSQVMPKDSQPTQVFFSIIINFIKSCQKFFEYFLHKILAFMAQQILIKYGSWLS